MNDITFFEWGVFTATYIANKWIRLLGYCLDPKAGERGLCAQLRGHCQLSANPPSRTWRRFAGKFSQTFTGRRPVTVLWLGGMGTPSACPALNFWTFRSRKSGGGMRQPSPASKQSAHWR